MKINRRELLGYSAAALGATAIGLPKTAKAAISTRAHIGMFHPA